MPNTLYTLLVSHFLLFWLLVKELSNKTYLAWKESSTVHQPLKIIQKVSFYNIVSINFKKKYIFGFLKVFFAHFWRKNSNTDNITVVQNHSKDLILQHCELIFEKRYIFGFLKYILLIFGAKIQTLQTISQWFKITEKVSFYNIVSINL